MKIVVTGATGNVGTSVLAALAADDRVEAISGIGFELAKVFAEEEKHREMAEPGSAEKENR